MKQIIQNMRSGKMSIEDVPPPTVGKGEVLVATKASLISAGTERMIMDFAQKSLAGKAKDRPDLVKKVLDKVQRDGLAATAQSVFARLDEPMPLGYSAAGEVLAVGADLSDIYQVGDKVAIAGAGFANHAEINAVPKNLVAKMPEGLSFEDASYATLTSIAMHGVRNADVKLGDNVLIMGLGLVGQLATQLVSASGGRAFAVEFDESRSVLAKEHGAEETFNLADGDPSSGINAFTNGNGFDSIIICAATESNEPLQNAINWARDRAKIILVGKVGTEIPYGDFMKKELQFLISRSYGPGRYDSNYEEKGQKYPIGYVRWTERDNLQEAVRLMAEGKLNVKALTTHTFDVEKAEEAYETSLAGGTALGVVLTYPSRNEVRQTTKIDLQPTEIISGQVGLAAIGAGGFTRAVLLPALQKIKGVSLTGIVSKGGTSSGSTGKKFGFGYASSNTDDVFRDEKTNAVMITTRHNTHADLVQQALSADKHVFVEKPLALSYDELEAVKKSHKGSGKVLMVGFNRRFSMLTQQVIRAFKDVSKPRQVLIRVNAGELPADNWQNDSEGGGRILGEVCHFIDLALYLTQAKPTDVITITGQGQDIYNITIRFDNGSTASIVYTSEGDTSFSKERIEVFGGGMVAVIDNFMTVSLTKNGQTKTTKAPGLPLIGGQDKGHKAELEAFVKAVTGQGDTPIKPEELFLSTRVTLAAYESIQENKGIKL